MSADRPDHGGRGIVGAAIHAPRSRLPPDALESVVGRVRATGVETIALPGADEDALTMAAAAAERALDTGPVERRDIGLLAFGTTTPPQVEGGLAGRIAAMLGLAPSVATAVFGGDLLCGAAALDRALDGDDPALVAVADCPPGDPAGTGARLGAGAAAFVVAADAPVPVLARGWHTDERPGVRYRPEGGGLASVGIRAYGRAAVRDGVTGAFERLASSLDGVDDRDAIVAAALHQPDGRTPERLSGALELGTDAAPRGTVAERVGDAGAAGVPLGLAAALQGRNEEDRTLAAFAGSEGGGAAFLLAGGIEVAGLDALDDGVEVDATTALRRRGQLGETEVAGGGAHVSLPTWQASLASRYRLTAGRCPDCGAVTFPPEGACPGCDGFVGYERVELARTGTVSAVTVIGQGGAPPEFAELQRRGGPYATAIVESKAPGGGSARLPAMLTDCDPSAVAIGDRVRATVRRLYERDGVVRYGAKFVPVDG